MAGCERIWPDRRLLEAVARIARADRVQVMDEVLPGESGSAFAVAAGDDQLVVKLVQAAGTRWATNGGLSASSATCAGEATQRPNMSAPGNPAAPSSPSGGNCPARAPSAGRSEIRILFVFDPWRSAILLVAGDKSGQWDQWYRTAIPRAEQLYDDYLTERKAETGL